MATSHVAFWEAVSPVDGRGGTLFDVWLVPSAEAASFAYQPGYPSAAVVAAPESAEARNAWTSGTVSVAAPYVRVPSPDLDRQTVLEAVRRWARDEHGVRGEIELA